MKVLITGSEGFIGTHLREEFTKNGYDVVRCDVCSKEDVTEMNILELEQTAQVIASVKPDVLINLAGQANVGLSWKKPQFTLELNTIGLVNVLEGVRAVSRDIRVIAIGSSDEYGVLRENGKNVTEDTPRFPVTPYAISKLSQEMFAKLYSDSYGMNICMTRQFNLGGAGQAKGFLLPDLASGIVEIEQGFRRYLSVGNLSSKRDFTHVSDACRAIRLIAEKGHQGEVYNICSGVTQSVQDILNRMIAMSTAEIVVRYDPNRMRPSDTPVICGNHDKLTAHTGWETVNTMDDILRDVMEYWRKAIKAE